MRAVLIVYSNPLLEMGYSWLQRRLRQESDGIVLSSECLLWVQIYNRRNICSSCVSVWYSSYVGIKPACLMENLQADYLDPDIMWLGTL